MRGCTYIMSFKYKTFYQTDLYYSLSALNYYLSDDSKFEFSRLPLTISTYAPLMLQAEIDHMIDAYLACYGCCTRIGKMLGNFRMRITVNSDSNDTDASDSYYEQFNLKIEIQKLLEYMRKLKWNNAGSAVFPYIRLTWYDNIASEEELFSIEGPACIVEKSSESGEHEQNFVILRQDTFNYPLKRQSNRETLASMRQQMHLQFEHCNLMVAFNAYELSEMQMFIQNCCIYDTEEYGYSVRVEMLGICPTYKLIDYFTNITMEAFADYSSIYLGQFKENQTKKVYDNILRDTLKSSTSAETSYLKSVLQSIKERFLRKED